MLSATPTPWRSASPTIPIPDTDGDGRLGRRRGRCSRWVTAPTTWRVGALVAPDPQPVSATSASAVPAAAPAAVRAPRRRVPTPRVSSSVRRDTTHRAPAAPDRDSGDDVPMTVGLGMPALPAPVLAERRLSRKIRLNHPTHPVEVGGDAPISVQSMTTTLTSDVNATLQQIAELTAAGCQIVRVAVPSQDDADALAQIARKSQIPVIADIHFQPKYVFAAIDAGCAAVRVNPGNIKQFDDKVGEIAQSRRGRRRTRSGSASTPGSLDKRLLEKYGKATPGGARRVGALGVLAVRGARLPRHQDLGQAQRPGRHGHRLPPARRALRLPAAPRRDRGRPGLPGHHQELGRVRRAARARASATRSASRCRRLRSRRSRSATRSSSRSTCASAASRSSPARPAAAPRSTSTRSPSRSPPASRA